MKFKKSLRTGLLALACAIPLAGCGQKVTIHRLDDIKAEADAEENLGYVEGIVTGMNYTSGSHGSVNRLSFVVKDNSQKYQQCYTEGTGAAPNENRNYSLAGSRIDSAKKEKSQIKVYGKRTDLYLEVREFETQGYRISFEQGEK